MTSFVFLFDKPNKKYFAGETINLRLNISVNSQFKARSLKLEFKGIGHTEWTKSGTITENNETNIIRERYTGDELYCRYYQYLFGGPNSGAKEVTTGVHTYTAKFKLPENVPSNLEHRNGHIRYSVKATYDVSWGFNKEEAETFFVTFQLNLNNFSELRNSIRQSEEKIFGCCCCESDPLKVVNVLPKGGYVPGEAIPIRIEVENDSDVWIDSIRVKFKKSLTFKVQQPRSETRSDTIPITEHTFQASVAPFQKKIFETQFYLDPRHDYKVFNGSGLITSDYYITSIAVSSGCHVNAENTTKIVIGTIPFREAVENRSYISVTPANFVPAVHLEQTTPTAPNVIVEQPLPTYREAIAYGTFDQPKWNSGIRNPFESTSNMNPENCLLPPTFNESQKNLIDFSSDKNNAVDVKKISPSAPPE